MSEKGYIYGTACGFSVICYVSHIPDLAIKNSFSLFYLMQKCKTDNDFNKRELLNKIVKIIQKDNKLTRVLFDNCDRNFPWK